MSPRYVEIPSVRFAEFLSEIGELVTAAGGSYEWTLRGRERVFDLNLSKGEGMIRVYTSIAANSSTARGCGKDAVRIIAGRRTADGFRPIEKSTKVLRTAPKGADDRVGAFLERLRVKLRGA